MNKQPDAVDDPLQPIRGPILPAPAMPPGHEDLKARVAALEEDVRDLKRQIKALQGRAKKT